MNRDDRLDFYLDDDNWVKVDEFETIVKIRVMRLINTNIYRIQYLSKVGERIQIWLTMNEYLVEGKNVRLISRTKSLLDDVLKTELKKEKTDE